MYRYLKALVYTTGILTSDPIHVFMMFVPAVKRSNAGARISYSVIWVRTLSHLSSTGLTGIFSYRTLIGRAHQTYILEPFQSSNVLWKLKPSKVFRQIWRRFDDVTTVQLYLTKRIGSSLMETFDSVTGACTPTQVLLLLETKSTTTCTAIVFPVSSHFLRQTYEKSPPCMNVLGCFLNMLGGGHGGCAAIRVQSPPGSLSDSRMWESCCTMPLVGGSSRGSPVSPAPSFRRCSILISITLIGSEDLDGKSRPNLFIPLNMLCIDCPPRRTGNRAVIRILWASSLSLVAQPRPGVDTACRALTSVSQRHATFTRSRLAWSRFDGSDGSAAGGRFRRAVSLGWDVDAIVARLPAFYGIYHNLISPIWQHWLMLTLCHRPEAIAREKQSVDGEIIRGLLRELITLHPRPLPPQNVTSSILDNQAKSVAKTVTFSSEAVRRRGECGRRRRDVAERTRRACGLVNTCRSSGANKRLRDWATTATPFLAAVVSCLRSRAGRGYVIPHIISVTAPRGLDISSLGESVGEEIWTAFNTEVSMEQFRNEVTGGGGEIPGKPADQRHRPARFPQTDSPWWEASRLTAQPPRPRRVEATDICMLLSHLVYSRFSFEDTGIANSTCLVFHTCRRRLHLRVKFPSRTIQSCKKQRRVNSRAAY
ncbi:hypothetical protein PR048_019332 [Dryococelus australis]|uniref:Uncharacterized protein n=1 Tax=Dryococelus australis TaxID=614101 RepID=A0ABQ9H367_9NEOP|nr:hypothetical protein PR048_019332 [Dryococelus australis]